MEQHPLLSQWRKETPFLDMENLAPDHASQTATPAESLTTSSTLATFTLGTGHSIYASALLPALLTARKEVILVTCFWAPSRTREALSETLLALSTKATGRRQKIRVRIYFSSSSLWQKLSHPQTPAGRIYAPAQWAATLGLPVPEHLPGLDVEVKSAFFLPFSVMHPKFLIVDRSVVFLPSCNVSWEDWLEGCVELRGPVVQKFVAFWKGFWASARDREVEFPLPSQEVTMNGQKGNPLHPAPLASIHLRQNDVPSIFLPSPHHRNPQFRLPWHACAPPPPTPLNTFLLTAFANASKDIYLQTPNLTCPPVLSALLAALQRGVDVTVVTSERLMILEQLVTAGTTTRRCVRKLRRRHARLVDEWTRRDVEGGGDVGGPGSLVVKFYVPDLQRGRGRDPEPVQSHVKVTIVDAEMTVLGSGNMDRASWYTSQELGVALLSAEVARDVRGQLDAVMQRRTR